MNQSRLNSESGMTLLEIMIVLAILGGLLAVLATNVMSSFNKSKVENTKIQMKLIGDSLNMYNLDCGSYPTSLEGLVSKDDCPNWGPDPYLKKVPRDAWNTEFLYEVDGSSYYLISLGEDRREGGSGLAADLNSDDL
ncbi:MAG: type II secretion system major pseudopilin GspG [Bdellovibrionales bacterium]|nr:type II secretion system major pseudopilin GspG [Bdellovibrionales bacterium]